MDSHYNTLGLAPSASADEIKAAYRRLAQKYHPDKNRHDPVGSAAMFTRVRQAYDTLMSPDLRREHDSELAREALFEAEFARRRNAYANATRGASWAAGASAGGSSGGGSGSNAGSQGAQHTASSGAHTKPAPTDWHARAWDLVLRAPSADALARALRGEGCLPSLASPLARDVALEYEQLRNATAQFQADTDPRGGARSNAQRANDAAGTGDAARAWQRAAAGESASDAAAARGRTQQASQQGAGRTGGGPNSAGQNGADLNSGGRRSAGQRSEGQQAQPRGRASREMPFGTPRRASGSQGARFGWVIVAAMVLILLWRYSPSTRPLALRRLMGQSTVEGTADTPRSYRGVVGRSTRPADPEASN